MMARFWTIVGLVIGRIVGEEPRRERSYAQRHPGERFTNFEKLPPNDFYVRAFSRQDRIRDGVATPQDHMPSCPGRAAMSACEALAMCDCWVGEAMHEADARRKLLDDVDAAIKKDGRS